MTTARPLVLIVEDDARIRRFLRPALEAEKYELAEAETGQAALVAASGRPPDLVVLDLGLPDMDGLEVTTRLREWTKAPILVLSARGREKDKVAALDAGADDYMTKPIGIPELLARIRAALRRRAAAGPGEEPAVTVGDLTVDFANRRVLVAGREAKLTPTEYRLLALLARHPGRVLTHAHMLREVWGPLREEESHYLRVHMANLRQKIEAEPARPRYLLTEQGVGYRLAAE
ncbi:MAG: response regulator [Planctomycetia bacterium]|nr:response regulator [Planctomycetia bacterium]